MRRPRNRNRNRNLKTPKALLKSQAHQGTSLFTSAATKRGFSKRVVKRSSGPKEKLRTERETHVRKRNSRPKEKLTSEREAQDRKRNSRPKEKLTSERETHVRK